MSTSLLKKGLILCEDTKPQRSLVKKLKNPKARVTKKDKNNYIKSHKKFSVNEARRQLESQKEILKHNLQMLKNAKKNLKVTLNKETADQIVERATSRKFKSFKSVEEEKGTVFTEEDFKKFEEEYFVE